MKKLVKLTQDEQGNLFMADGSKIQRVFHEDKIRTLVIRNAEGLEACIDALCARNSVLIPKYANCYYASEFNGDTQHIRKNSKTGEETMFSVYAVQFGCSWQVA